MICVSHVDRSTVLYDGGLALGSLPIAGDAGSTIAELMAAVAVIAVACVWPVLLIVGLGRWSERCTGKRRRRRLGISLAVVTVCLYAPFGWLLLIGEPWDSYRLTWS